MPANTSPFLLLSRGSLLFSPSKGPPSKGKMGKSGAAEEQLSNTSTQPSSTRPPNVVTPLGAMMNESEAPTWTDVTLRDLTSAKAKYGCCTAREAEKIHTWFQESRIDHSGAQVHA